MLGPTMLAVMPQSHHRRVTSRAAFASAYRARIRTKLLQRGYREEGIEERVEEIMVRGERFFAKLAVILRQAMEEAETEPDDLDERIRKRPRRF